MAKPTERDKFYDRAKREHFVARSIYKLDELDKRFGLIRPGDVVLDLGCAPGSWLQYLARRVGPQGRVVGIDLNPVRATLPPHVVTLVGDVDAHGLDALRAAAGAPDVQFDAVVSDLAPHTTGITFADAARSMALCERGLELALALLRPGGHFVTKFFMGVGAEQLVAAVRPHFDKTRHAKPEGSRKESKEMYLVATGRKKPPPG